MTSLSDVKQAEIIEAFKSTSRYLDDLLNIDNPYFEGMVNRIYQPELQLNEANTSDTEAPFLDLHLSISNGFVSSEIYDKRDDFDFDIVNFPFLDGDVPRSTSYGVYISQLIRFARVSSHVVDFNARNKSLTAKLLQQGYRYYKLRKTFSKFYHCLSFYFFYSADIKIFYPGVVCPDLRLFTFINHEIMCIQSEIEEILFKLAATDRSDKTFLLTSKCWP